MAEFLKTRPQKKEEKGVVCSDYTCVLTILLKTSLKDNAEASVKRMLRFCEAAASQKKKHRKTIRDSQMMIGDLNHSKSTAYLSNSQWANRYSLLQTTRLNGRRC